MQVKSLNINNLRNIISAQIDPDSQLNCFIGDNGAGKTSVLEALVVLSKGRSFRTGQISSLIGPDQKNFQVISRIESQNGDLHQLGLERGTDHWTARHNSENVSQLSEFTRLLPHVLLEPSSHTLVSGPPEGRRRYVDWGVFHVEPSYLLLWRRYNRVLKQRNAALRQSNSLVIDSLNPQLVDFGEQLHQSRKKYILRLSTLLQQKLPQFNQVLGDINLIYRKGWAGDDLAEAVQLSLSRDLERGSTGPGPHKADLYLAHRGAPAKERLSRGEQKAMTAAMIMAQAELMCESGELPLLMLDDLSSEFDESHLEKVLGMGMDLGVQIWLTGTVLVPEIKAYQGACKVFHVKQGRILVSG